MSTYIKVQGSAVLTNLKVATSADGGNNGGGGGENPPENGWFAGTNTYYINSQATTLNEFGDGTWNGDLYSGGVLFTGTSDGVYYVNGNPATGVYSGTYYVSGVAGTGTSGGVYYVDGSPANGVHGGLFYVNGVIGSGLDDITLYYYHNGSLATGYYNSAYYINGQETVLNSSGNGYWAGTYYIGGVATSLNSNGTGTYNGSYYEDGVAVVSTGTYNGLYYIDGVSTTLYSNGTGTWNNLYYYEGSLANGVYFRSDLGSNQSVSYTSTLYNTNNYYHLNGAYTNLNEGGDGSLSVFNGSSGSGLTYNNGTLAQGWTPDQDLTTDTLNTQNYYFYLSGSAGILGRSGRGIYNGDRYENAIIDNSLTGPILDLLNYSAYVAGDLLPIPYTILFQPDSNGQYKFIANIQITEVDEYGYPVGTSEGQRNTNGVAYYGNGGSYVQLAMDSYALESGVRYLVSSTEYSRVNLVGGLTAQKLVDGTWINVATA